MHRIVLFLMLLTAVNVSADDSFSVYCLTTEQAENPTGIDSQSPRFSWKIYAQKRNFKQYAYQVCVADSPDKLMNSGVNIWDSGKVFSDKSILIPFKGLKLKSSEVYYWRVRIWNDEDNRNDWEADKTANEKTNAFTIISWHSNWFDYGIWFRGTFITSDFEKMGI